MTFEVDTRTLYFYVDGALIGSSVITQADYDEWQNPSWYIDDPQNVYLGNPDRIQRNDLSVGANFIQGAFRSPQDGAVDQFMIHTVYMDADQVEQQASVANL
jgi:hypothetical protein